MTKAILIDTETTDKDDPRPIEIGWSEPFENPNRDIFGAEPLVCCVSRFNPGKPIKFGAMAIHHITDAMVQDCPPWTDYKLPDGCSYLIGHNVDFDWKALGQPAVKRICTLALSRQIWPDADAHTLGALLYMLDIEYAQRMVPGAHSAANDVVLCAKLLSFITSTGYATDIVTMEDLWQWSETARVPERMTFGKHGPKDGQPGMKCADVRRLDPGYFKWLMSSCDQVRDDPYLKKALTG